MDLLTATETPATVLIPSLARLATATTNVQAVTSRPARRAATPIATQPTLASVRPIPCFASEVPPEPVAVTTVLNATRKMKFVDQVHDVEFLQESTTTLQKPVLRALPVPQEGRAVENQVGQKDVVPTS